MSKNWCQLSKADREQAIFLEQKEEFTNLCKSYFETFMWKWEDTTEGVFVTQIVPGARSYLLLIVLSPHEDYPALKNIKNLLKTNQSVLVVSPEFSPAMRVPKKHEAHTASGIHFVYFKHN